MGWLYKAVLRYFSKAPAKLPVLSKAAGRTIATAKDAASFASQNKVNAALTAVNMGSFGAIIADFLVDDGAAPEVVKILEGAATMIDELAPNAELSIDDIGNYSEEIALIRRVANRTGGMERLMELRTVLSLPNQYFELESAVRNLSR